MRETQRVDTWMVSMNLTCDGRPTSLSVGLSSGDRLSTHVFFGQHRMSEHAAHEDLEEFQRTDVRLVKRVTKRCGKALPKHPSSNSSKAIPFSTTDLRIL